jgi:hypothetical protein
MPELSFTTDPDNSTDFVVSDQVTAAPARDDEPDVSPQG